MAEKIVLYAFQGEQMCFVHVLLNALDMHEKGHDVKIVIEGSATKLVKVFHDEGKKNPFYQWYVKVKDAGLIDGACKACATKMGSIAEVEKERLPLLGAMSGHPPMATYIEDGYTIITF